MLIETLKASADAIDLVVDRRPEDGSDDDRVARCEACNARARRRLGAIAPEGWLFMEGTDNETGSIMVIHACSSACALALWRRGPGRLDLSDPAQVTKDTKAPNAFSTEPDQVPHALVWDASIDLRALVDQSDGQSVPTGDVRAALERLASHMVPRNGHEAEGLLHNQHPAVIAGLLEWRTDGGFDSREGDWALTEHGAALLRLHAHDHASQVRLVSRKAAQ
jgi:hypothetical protein